MREARPARLLRTALLAGATLIPLLWSPHAAIAMPREVRMCTTQTEDLADQRIAACTTMLKWGRLKGEPEGIAYALRGLAYLDRGDIAHAIGDLNHAITLAPDFAPAYQNRGNAWYARGNYGQAMADYDEAIKLDPSFASPFVNRATLRRDLGNTNGALDDFAKAININPRHAGAYSGRGELYLRQKNFARAISDFDHALKLAPSGGNYMLRAQARAEAGNLDQALADYHQAERLDPKSVAAMTAEAGIWRKKGDLDKAIAAYNRALSADDKRPATYKLRAEAFAAKGERKRAMADIGRALKFTWNVDLLKTRAALRLDDGDMTGVVHDTDAMLKAEPNNADALTLRGAALARKKDYVHALPDLDKAIAADGKNALALGERGQVYLAKGDTNRALADLNRAISLGSTSPAPYRARAMIYKQKGDTAKALSDLDAAIRHDPHPADLYVERAALMDTKSHAKAVDDLDSAIRLNPRNAHGYYQRGLAHERNGDFSKAITDYKMALARNRKFNEARKALARATIEARHAKSAVAKHTDDKPKAVEREETKSSAAESDAKADQKAPQKDVVLPAPAPKRAEQHDKPVTAALPSPKAHTHAKPRDNRAEEKPLPVAAAPATENPAKASAPAPVEAPQKARAPQPRDRKHIGRSPHERKTTPHATSSVWTDEHGRPLSAREIQEIKRLLREGDGRGSRRSGRAPVRYHRAGSNATFEDIWR